MPGHTFVPLAAPAGAISMNRAYVYVIALVAAISGFLFGFDIAVINGALILLRDQFRLTEFQTGFAASSLLIGCVAGAAIAGVLSDRFGRRRILLLSALLFAASSLGAALPRTLPEFAAARFIGGVAIGVASVLAPLYIAEVAPPAIRGRLVSLNQMAIVTGILAAYSVNWGLAALGPASWRWMFATAALPSLAFFFALLFVPESPRFLAARSRPDRALAILARIGGTQHAARELRQIEQAISSETASFAELFRPGLRRPLAIAVALAVLQQVTGINTVLFYGSIIFKEHTAATSRNAIGANVLVGLVNFLMTIVALFVIDKVGRKPLLMVSSAGMALAEIALGIAFRVRGHGQPPAANLIVAAMLFCVASFAVGMGPGVWVLMSELFPTRIRGRAMSVATISLWVACVALTLTFLSLVQAVTVSGAFWIYAALCVATFLFVWRVTPETKGKTLEEIEQIWRPYRKVPSG